MGCVCVFAFFQYKQTTFWGVFLFEKNMLFSIISLFSKVFVVFVLVIMFLTRLFSSF